MTENIAAKQVVENELAEKLSAQGVNVAKRIDLFPLRLQKEKMGSQDDLQAAMAENGFDAILKVNLLEEETETRYVQGTPFWSPINRFGFYGNFWG
jgi:hypothetical protein